jgi:pimeloyl-ACP methyl ester carboxylesterase
MALSDGDRFFLDHPDILKFIFYPRRDEGRAVIPPNATDVLVFVERDVHIGCRFYHGKQNGPNLLFFHGNGEIVSDYDGIAPLYAERGLNLFVADYRGYGFSGGTPTVSDMIRDTHPIFQEFLGFLKQGQYDGPVFVMGRSLGSGSALELASKEQDHISGLIIESGFSDTFDLLNSLGIPLQLPQDAEDRLVSNREKITKIPIPTLFIHAEEDHIIPLYHARDLYEASGAEGKRLVIIPNADHNDLLWQGQVRYFEAILSFVLSSH